MCVLIRGLIRVLIRVPIRGLVRGPMHGPISPSALLLLLLLSLSGWLAPAGVQAHALPGTAVLLDFGPEAVDAELLVPLEPLGLAFGQPLADEPARVIERHGEALRHYLAEHVRATSVDGRPWELAVTDLAVLPATASSAADLQARLQLTAPAGTSPRRLHLEYSVVNHEVRTHTVLVFVRSDWRNGVLAQQPELIGTIRWLTTGLDIDRNPGGNWRGLVAAFRLGMQHIAEGADHLLFLATLLLAAPLRRQPGRWGGFAGSREACLRLAALVTAFTVGHSVTLLASVLGNLPVPTQPIEILVAASILVSALHVARPLLIHGEVLLAAGFGLVHGLAFSQALAGAGLGGWQKVGAVLGFNLGIECVQLLIVALSAPLLFWLARRPAYRGVRLAGATLAGLAALLWIVERSQGTLS